MRKSVLLIVWLLLLDHHPSLCLNAVQVEKIGMQIWKNESGQRTDLLIHWHKDESFPSLGIGHNIWFLQGQEKIFTEQFPLLCDYLQKKGVTLPVWLQKAKRQGAPWKNRDDFLNDHKKARNLRHILSSTIKLQTDFMIERLDKQWPLILQGAPKKERSKILAIYTLMRSTLRGTYILVDYLNFKGNGIDPKEQINGHRWGLLQVLLDMPHGLKKDTVNLAFTLSAMKMLLILIQHSAPEYSRMKFLNGWINRLNTYSSQETFGIDE